MFASCFSILVLGTFLSFSFLVPSAKPSFTGPHCTSLQHSIHIQETDQDNYTVERVLGRNRALDLMVFRQWSISAAEYQRSWFDTHNGEHLDKQEAVERLTPAINNFGQDTTILGGPMVSFVAILLNDASLDRTHGVVAAVDAKLNPDDIYLKNLLVDERARRRGIASALVQAIKDLAEMTCVNEIVLHVERHNANAIALYEKEGFEFAEEYSGDGRMVCKVD